MSLCTRSKTLDLDFEDGKVFRTNDPNEDSPYFSQVNIVFKDYNDILNRVSSSEGGGGWCAAIKTGHDSRLLGRSYNGLAHCDGRMIRTVPLELNTSTSWMLVYPTHGNSEAFLRRVGCRYVDAIGMEARFQWCQPILINFKRAASLKDIQFITLPHRPVAVQKSADGKPSVIGGLDDPTDSLNSSPVVKLRPIEYYKPPYDPASELVFLTPTSWTIYTSSQPLYT